MLKITIPNFQVNGKHGRGNDLARQIARTLRKQDAYSGSESAYHNPVASKLRGQNMRHSDWISADIESLVIIDDSREEVAEVSKKGLMTTTLLLNEILNSNNGVQNYEYERNKFFVQDDTSNSSTVLHADQMWLLDVIWAMREQGAKAVEITMGERMKSSKLLSKRYTNLINDYVEPLKEVTIAKLKEHYQEWETFAKKADGGTVDFSKGKYDREIEEDSITTFSMYSGVAYCIEEYCDEQRKNIENDKDIRSFDDFVSWFVNGLDSLSQMPEVILGIQQGYCHPHLDTTDDYMDALKGRVVSWKVLARSQFKRNQDWKANPNNIVKAEVLKLRADMEEGTFNE